jgi:hypothetical protein
MPDLWCRPCDQNHTLTTGETERLVYQLIAESQTRLEAEPERRQLTDESLCLNRLHAESLDDWDSSAQVDEAVEARRVFNLQHGSVKG